MKNSSRSEIDEVNGNLCVDLFNLIVESRMPRINERGYGNGYHCPPLLGQNMHFCDLKNPECQKHETMIHHLLRAVRHNVFEIEVLMLPDCCDLKLSDRIQHKEYVLLERWSMSLFESDKVQLSIDINELLRAVRSFLHFSQISAWLSSTKGKSPANIYYWVKPTTDPSGTQFENNPEVHEFPRFKVNDEICGTVRVNYPTRKQYIPIIPCSKHPPSEIRLRLTTDSNLISPVPLNPQFAKHFQKTSCKQEPITAVKQSCSGLNSLKSSSRTVLKHVVHKMNDFNKTNRVPKYSNYRIAVKATNGAISNSCDAQICNRKEISPKSEVRILSSCQQTHLKCSSQENLCLNKSPFTNVLPKSESKTNTLNKDLLPSYDKTNSLPLETSHPHTAMSNIPKFPCSTTNYININACNVFSNVYNILSTIEPSQSSVSNTSHENASLLKIQKNNCRNSFKRKHFLEKEELHIIPTKKICFYKEKCEKKNRTNSQLSLFCQSKILMEPSKRKYCHIFPSSRSVSNLVKTGKIKNGLNNKFNIEESLNISMVESSFKRKAVGEMPNQSLKNCANQQGSDCSKNILCSENNMISTNTFVKSELVNLLEQTGCTNPLNTSPSILKRSVFLSNRSWNVLPQKATMYYDCFPSHELKFARGRKLLGNFEESILKGCLLPVSNVEGFHTEIGASGSFCPNHITLPADVTFYDMDNLHSLYMANVTFSGVEYCVPKKGAVQVTLFNPSETVVKMFVLNYDLSDMPPSRHTFIRQKTYFMPISSTEECPSSSKWLRFLLHLRFASSKTGKLYLYKDLKIVVLNKSNDDAASEFSQEPHELRSFLHVPMNPTFSLF